MTSYQTQVDFVLNVLRGGDLDSEAARAHAKSVWAGCPIDYALPEIVRITFRWSRGICGRLGGSADIIEAELHVEPQRNRVSVSIGLKFPMKSSSEPRNIFFYPRGVVVNPNEGSSADLERIVRSYCQTICIFAGLNPLLEDEILKEAFVLLEGLLRNPEGLDVSLAADSLRTLIDCEM